MASNSGPLSGLGSWGTIIQGIPGVVGSAFGTPSSMSGSGTSNTTSNSNSTGTSNTTGTLTGTQSQTSSSTPTFDPITEALRQQLIQSAGQQLSSVPSANSLISSGIQNINQGTDASRSALQQTLAARGLTYSPLAGSATANLENQRIGAGVSYANQAPALQQQLYTNALSNALNTFRAMPFATTGTTTGSTNQSQSQNTTQNQTTSGTQNTNQTQQQQQKTGGGWGGVLGAVGGLLGLL